MSDIPKPELPRQLWGMLTTDGQIRTDEYFSTMRTADASCGVYQRHGRNYTPILLHDQDAIDELIYLAEVTARSAWMPDEFRAKLRAAIASVKGGE